MSEKVKEKKKSRFGKLFRFSFLLFIILILPVLYAIDYKILNEIVFKPQTRIVYDTFKVYIDESIPQEFEDTIKEKLGSVSFNGKSRFEFVDEKAHINISDTTDEQSVDVFKKDLIAVGHVYSLLTEISQKNLSSYNVYLLDNTYAQYIKEQYKIDTTVMSTKEELVAKLKSSDKNIALVGFGDLDPSLKVLYVDDSYFLDNQEGSIPIRFYAKMNDDNRQFILSVMKKNLTEYIDDWSVDNLAKVNMSGVVAIARALAYKMDSLKDYDYPAKYIGSFLADADLTHISNEVSFVEGCKVYSGMRFCSNPKYMETLTASGVDIVELTGNHNNDFGSSNSTKSIQMYVDQGMRYFGGGLNTEDASKILYEEVKGTKIAFIGYNYYDTMLKTLALAGESRSGANSYSDEKMESDIQEARDNGADIIIVDFQFQECYSYPSGDVVFPICYKPLSSPDQKGTFKKAIDYGADIVIGTQAHQPQTYELYKNGIIFYGLGNLYFDQKHWIGTRQAMILTHYFYDGKHIQTKITPTYMDSTLQTKIATDSQRDQLLKSLKGARN
ncbi:MAG: CapA family protein [Candidatus Dojkabacteria bacterium]|nr:CapA family protein [Candidatus Dojkabacteria bacterium]